MVKGWPTVYGFIAVWEKAKDVIRINVNVVIVVFMPDFFVGQNNEKQTRLQVIQEIILTGKETAMCKKVAYGKGFITQLPPVSVVPMNN
jgi:hypothetical protein